MPTNHDLGTYFLRVEFADDDGYIETWETGARYEWGDSHYSPLDAKRIGCTWHSESDLFDTMRFQYIDGNYSCDCNKALFLARSKQQDEPDMDCGDTIIVRRLTAIRPDGSECVLWSSDAN